MKTNTDTDYFIVELHVKQLVDIKLLDTIHEYLTDNCNHNWFIKYPKIYFGNEKEHLMFILKFS